MDYLTRVGTVSAILAISSASSGQDFTVVPASKYVGVQGLQGQSVDGGKPADPKDWPATFYIDAKQGPCTSTLVGPRALLTAAHCVADNAQGEIQDASGRWSAPVTCRRHHHYRRVGTPSSEAAESPDFALCVLKFEYPNAKCDTVDVSGKDLEVGHRVTLLGYGCHQHRYSYNQLYTGSAEIKKLPKDPSYFTVTDGGASVCEADSGGGAYRRMSNGRLLFAVNHKWVSNKRSLLATTSVPGFVEWARKWAEENRVEICGLHQNPACRR